VRARAAALADTLPGAAEMLDKLAAGIVVEGMESLAPALVESMVPVVDLVLAESLLVVSDPERVRRRAHDLVATTEEFLAAAWTSDAAGGATPLDLSAASFLTFAQVRAVASARGLGWWTMGPFGLPVPDGASGDGPVQEDVVAQGTGEALVVTARDVEGYHGDVARAVDDVRTLQRAG